MTPLVLIINNQYPDMQNKKKHLCSELYFTMCVILQNDLHSNNQYTPKGKFLIAKYFHNDSSSAQKIQSQLTLQGFYPFSKGTSLLKFLY